MCQTLDFSFLATQGEKDRPSCPPFYSRQQTTRPKKKGTKVFHTDVLEGSRTTEEKEYFIYIYTTQRDISHTTSRQCEGI